MEETAANQIPLPEDHYSEIMQKTVEPALAACRKEFFLERIPGRKLYVEQFTPAHPKSVLILSHGFTESALKFHELAWYFYQKDYAVIIPDHAGHGKSFRLVQDPSLVHIDHWQAYRDDFCALIDQTVEKFPGLPLIVLGHSMGGAIAAVSVEERAASIRKLILSSPMILPLTGSMPVPAARLLGVWMKLSGQYTKPLPGYHPYDGTYTFEESNTQSRARFDYYQNLQNGNREIQTDGGTYGWAAESLKMDARLMKNAAKLTMPVLLLQAELDQTVSLPAQNQFIRRVPSGRLISYPAKHEIYREKNEILQNYLRDVFRFLEEIGH